jgi:hypothetical protein
LFAEVQNLFKSPQAVVVRFQVVARDSGEVLLQSASSIIMLGPSPAPTVIATVHVSLPASILLWSIATPNLYNLKAFICTADSSTVLDTGVTVTVGWRTTEWDADNGFFLNGNHVKQRGFSHHNSFGGVGVAIPQRLDVFRVQVSRALGGNIWYFNPNICSPALL